MIYLEITRWLQYQLISNLKIRVKGKGVELSGKAVAGEMRGNVQAEQNPKLSCFLAMHLK